MIYEIAIEVPFDYENLCLGVLNAVKPDNITAPSGIEIEMECRNAVLRITVRGFDVGILTIRNTVDDIFMHLLSAYRVLQILTK
ncbi:MAG: KEOPS complex subunit Pcc1 [Ignisphaera sp.]